MVADIRVREEVGRVTACPERSRMGARRPSQRKQTFAPGNVRSACRGLPALPTLRRAMSSRHRFRLFPINQSIDPLVPAMFDCSKIHELGIDKQENMRAGAIMVYCGEAQGGAASPAHGFSQLVQTLLSPLAYGTTDVDLITGAEISPNVTQSETFTASNPDNPNQIVVAYNDSRGRNVSPINI